MNRGPRLSCTALRTAASSHRGIFNSSTRSIGCWRIDCRSYGAVLGPLDPLYLQATTACLAAIVVAQVVNVFVCRHPQEAALRFGLRSNPLLLAGVAVEIALILLIVYTPFGNAALGTAPLPARAWGLMILLALAFGLLEELRKRLLSRRAWLPVNPPAPAPG